MGVDVYVAAAAFQKKMGKVRFFIVLFRCVGWSAIDYLVCKIISVAPILGADKVSHCLFNIFRDIINSGVEEKR